MESQLQSSSTYAAQAYAETYFAQFPTDSRVLNTSYQKFPPESIVENKTIKFSFSRYEAGNAYLIQGRIKCHLNIIILYCPLS